MGPSDSLLPTTTGYLFPLSAGTSFADSRTSGSPKFLVVLSVRAVSFHPGEPTWAFFSIIPPKQFWFRPLRGIDHSHFCLSRPFLSSLSLRLAPLSSEATKPLLTQ